MIWSKSKSHQCFSVVKPIKIISIFLHDINGVLNIYYTEMWFEVIEVHYNSFTFCRSPTIWFYHCNQQSTISPLCPSTLSQLQINFMISVHASCNYLCYLQSACILPDRLISTHWCTIKISVQGTSCMSPKLSSSSSSSSSWIPDRLGMVSSLLPSCGQTC